jgi:ubiquinone/menaquinone biosynthesis C-methylase UbiE
MSDSEALRARQANIEVARHSMTDPPWLEYHRNRPLDSQHHVVDLQTTFDFSVVALNLRANPGDRILDLGAGSCWASEWLNRLRFKTVACDVSTDLLQIGQDRLGYDRRISPELAQFVAGDAEELPFADESFDGIICISSFHHLTDYERALREIHRVLKTGRRAVFSEPGSTHSQHVSSLDFEAWFGAPERDIHLAQIFEHGRVVGFDPICLEPYVYPCSLTLSSDEWQQLRSGDEKLLQRYIRTLGRAVEEDHTLIVMVKPGERGLDSRYPNVLRARIEPLDFPQTIGRGEILRGRVKVQNTGDTLWLAAQQEMGGHVTMGLKAFNEGGAMVTDSLYRAALPHNLKPGEAVELVVVAPVNLPPGRYELKFDMVDELLCWFEDAGATPVIRSLVVR